MSSEHNNHTGNSKSSDPVMDDLYQRSSREQPPESLDQLILKKAHDSNKKPGAGSPFSGGWKIPFSMAAVMVLGLVVLLRLGVAPDDPYPVMQESVSIPAGSMGKIDTAIEQDTDRKEFHEAVDRASSLQKLELPAVEQKVEKAEVMGESKKLNSFSSAPMPGSEKIKRDSGSRVVEMELYNTSPDSALDPILPAAEPSSAAGMLSKQKGVAKLKESNESSLEKCITIIEKLIAEGDMVAARDQFGDCQQAFPDADVSEIAAKLGEILPASD